MPSLSVHTQMLLHASQARRSELSVLQWSRYANQLIVWRWPSSPAGRLHPSEMESYRMSYRMSFPCCLCPLADENQPDFVEAAIYTAVDGPLTGKYIASCARDLCGYFVHLDQFYNKFGLHTDTYPRRVYGERIPPRVVHIAQGVDGGATSNVVRVTPTIIARARPLKRSYAMLDVTETLVPRRLPPKMAPAHIEGRRGISSLLERLDSRIRPGVKVAEFKRLFVQCATCEEIFTGRAFRRHQCQIALEIIDLTDEDEIIDLTDEDEIIDLTEDRVIDLTMED